ncbi:hypothetical protein AB4043_21815, partial [Terriglobus sp. YAF25]
VQDESMGEDVKITVIATGFKQEMPQRRERMLQEAMEPAVRYDARPSAMPRFASETPVMQKLEIPIAQRPESPSVFEDEFFLTGRERRESAVPPPQQWVETTPEMTAPAPDEQPQPIAAASAVPEPVATFASTPSATVRQEQDELDIPAFLRRGGM